MISTRHSAPRETNISTDRTYRPLLVLRLQDLQDLRPQDLWDHLRPGDTAIGLAVRVGAGVGTQALHRLITGEFPFLVIPETSDDSLFETIALCMFSRQYIRIDDMPVLAWQTPPAPELIRRLQAQGWPEIRQWDMHHVLWLKEQHQAGGLADMLIATPDQPYIFIEGNDLNESFALEEALRRHWEDQLHDNPRLHAVITEKHRLQKKLDALKSEFRVLQERMQQAESTIGIIRNKYKDDYDTLFNWYHQEYEVLPLWYKRFGQLIKVLTGKRTAKSLVMAIHRRLHRHTAPYSSNSHQKKGRT